MPQSLATPQMTRIYTALGASVTYGQGATYIYAPRSPVPAPVATSPSANNYASLAANSFAGRPYQWTNGYQDIGISGAGVQTLTANGVPLVSAQASLITIFIGADDIGTVAKYPGGIQAGVNWWKGAFTNLIADVRAQHPAARIVLVNLANYRVAAGQPGATGSFAVQAMDTQVINPYVQSGVAVIDTICSHVVPGASPTVPWWYNAAYHPLVNGAYDWKHPNVPGHAQLAQDIVNTTAAPVNPKPDCPPYLCHSVGLNPDSHTVCT